MTVYENAAQLVGGTKLFTASKFAESVGASAEIVVKLEATNPAGSVKDRIAKAMIEDAEARGVLKPGSHIVEPTSGNTGIALAAIGTAKGYKVTLVLPASMSVERRAMIQAYGGNVLVTPAAKAIKGSIAYVNEWKEKDPSIVVLDQFNNPANPKVHYETTGPEIWDATEGKIDVLVATIGTGGTISGAGKFLREKNPDIKIFGVEPEDSPVLNGGQPAPHKLQGIGTGFVPGTLDTEIYDEVLTAGNDESFEYARKFGLAEGAFVGITSGSALVAATKVATRPEFAGKRIVTILPDSGDRYLSTPLGQFPDVDEVDVEA